MDSKLLNKLNKRIEEGTLRSLSSFEGSVDFYSNDYLGATKFTFPLEGEKSAMLNGSSGSRLISGSNRFTEDCEKELASFFGTEAALVFNSGYDANLGLFSSILQKGDTILYDEYIHASIRDGIRLGLSNSYSFKHNNTTDLEKKLSLASGTVYVSIESIYSMDGDIAPLEEIIELCFKYNAYLIVDEAHAAGVFGREGRGLVDSVIGSDKIFSRVITFGKAYGGHGACVIGSANLVQYLVNFSRSFMYTTALPPNTYSRIKNIVTDDRLHVQRTILKENVLYFNSLFQDVKIDSAIISPIKLIKIGEVSKTKFISEKLQKHKIAIKAIYSPTVPVGSEGIRICLHSFNTKEQIKMLYSIINTVL